MTDLKASYTLLVADIHLQPDETSPINQTFIHFLETQAAQADALYILGDLFEMWVGDDMGLSQYQSAISALKKLSDSGVPIYALYGNRDFLMRDAFWQASGIQPLPEISSVTIYELPLLLCHGDELCTDDTGYQRMRRFFRHPWVQRLFLWLPQKRRLAIGAAMRRGSSANSQQKMPASMDVTDQAVQALFQTHPQCNHLIHGHTHQPAHHQLTIDHQVKHRWVLGDWRPQAQLLKIKSNQQLELISFPAS